MLFSALVKRGISIHCVRTLFQPVACLWEGDAGRFADLSVDVEGLDIAIKPQNPGVCYNGQQHSEESFASVWLESSQISSTETFAKELILPGFSAVQNGRKLSWSFVPKLDVRTSLSKLTQPRLFLRLPLHCELGVRARSHANIFIDNMEAGCLSVDADEGTCQLNSVKAQSITVCGHGAVDVRSDTYILGNLTISTSGSGLIHLKRAQGHHVNLSTDKGSINVAALYGAENTLSTQNGRIDLTSVHGETRIDVAQGDVQIASASGDVTLVSHQGNARVHLDTIQNAELSVQQGDLHFTTSSTNVTVDFCGRDVSLLDGKSKDSIVYLRQDNGTLVGRFVGGSEVGRPFITAKCPEGSLVWCEQSWFDSLWQQS